MKRNKSWERASVGGAGRGARRRDEKIERRTHTQSHTGRCKGPTPKVTHPIFFWRRVSFPWDETGRRSARTRVSAFVFVVGRRFFCFCFVPQVERGREDDDDDEEFAMTPETLLSKSTSGQPETVAISGRGCVRKDAARTAAKGETATAAIAIDFYLRRRRRHLPRIRWSKKINLDTARFVSRLFVSRKFARLHFAVALTQLCVHAQIPSDLLLVVNFKKK